MAADSLLDLVLLVFAGAPVVVENCSRALHTDVVLPSPSHSAAWRVTVAASMPRRGFTRCHRCSVVAECESQSVQVYCWSGTQKLSLSQSLYFIVFASLSVFSLFVFCVSIFCLKSQRLHDGSGWRLDPKRSDQHCNPEVRVVAHQPRKKNLFALLLLPLIHKRSLSVGYLRALSCFSTQNKLMKMLVDPVFSRGFQMQKVVAPISHTVYKCMLPKFNLSDILSTLFQ